MTVNVLNRMVVAVGISAVALFGLNVPTNAQSQPQNDQKRQEDQKEEKQQKAKKRAQQEQARQQKAQQPRGRDSQQRQQQRLAPQVQQQLIRQQQQRLVQYRDHLDQQQRLAQPQSVRLRQQNRMAQYGFQQQYLARLRTQQSRIQVNYDYGRDPYFYTPSSFRYLRDGRYYETNQYGVDLLRQAVNVGYEEGVLAGLADRQDRWRSAYADSYAYQDANYGYTGFYVDRDDYNNYFREGFRRGYEDGYSGGYRYGRYADGRGTILGNVLSVIISFESVR